MALTKADMAESLYEELGLNKREAKELVELMGGTISVESEIGKGSRFIIQVPLS